MSYCIDANVFITAWYVTYPKKTFPTLYRELESKLSSQIILIKPIFDEIEPIPGGDKKLDILNKNEKTIYRRVNSKDYYAHSSR